MKKRFFRASALLLIISIALTGCVRQGADSGAEQAQASATPAYENSKVLPSPSPPVKASTTPSSTPSASIAPPTEAAGPTLKPTTVPTKASGLTLAPLDEKSFSKEIYTGLNTGLQWDENLYAAALEGAKQAAASGNPKQVDMQAIINSRGLTVYGWAVNSLMIENASLSELKPSIVLEQLSGTSFTGYSHIGIAAGESGGRTCFYFLTANAKYYQSSFLSQVEREILTATNAERTKYNLAPLSWDDAAWRIAQTKTKEMYDNQYFEHSSPITGDLKNQFIVFGGLELGVDVTAIGENIAMTQGYDVSQMTAQYFVTQWMNSPGHRENILSDAWSHMGAGVYFGSDGRCYAAQEFCKY